MTTASVVELVFVLAQPNVKQFDVPKHALSCSPPACFIRLVMNKSFFVVAKELSIMALSQQFSWRLMLHVSGRRLCTFNRFERHRESACSVKWLSSLFAILLNR